MEVRGMALPSLTRRGLLVAASTLGVAHFAIGILLVIRLMIALPMAVGELTWFLLPYFGLLLLFATACILAWQRRLKWSGLALVLALVLSVGMCVYDFRHHRWQIAGGGTGHTYLIWWWYYEPWWHGYKPGNV
jgi:hypothetical protein